MNCAEFENLLADYIDGSLADTQRWAIEEHATSCAACREFMSDVTGALAFLKRADQVVPPPELVTRIAYQAPIGRTREPFETQGIWSKVSAAWLQPFLRPRFAMGMAMTILSFAMLQRCTGVQVQHIQPADLSPVRIWDGIEDKVIRVKDRAVKYYENIRLVYEIQTRLKDLQEQQEMVRNRQGQETSPNRSAKREDGRKTPNQRDNRQGDKKP
jgi:putative zinc finger protein